MNSLYNYIIEANETLTPLTRVLCAASNYRRTELEGLPRKDLDKLVAYIKAECKTAKPLNDYTNAQEVFDAGNGVIKIQLTDKNKIGDVYIFVDGSELHYCSSYAYCQPCNCAEFKKFYPEDKQFMLFIAKSKDILKLVKNTPVPFGPAMFGDHSEFVDELKQRLGITAKTINIS